MGRNFSQNTFQSILDFVVSVAIINKNKLCKVLLATLFKNANKLCHFQLLLDKSRNYLTVALLIGRFEALCKQVCLVLHNFQTCLLLFLKQVCTF